MSMVRLSITVRSLESSQKMPNDKTIIKKWLYTAFLSIYSIGNLRATFSQYGTHPELCDLLRPVIYGTNRKNHPLLMFAGTGHNRKYFTALRVFLPSECEWVFRYAFEVAIPSLIGRSTVERINKINTDGDMQIYNPRCDYTR
jgi:hypothetical protein